MSTIKKHIYYKQNFKDGEVYIVDVHHYVPWESESSTFYKVRALCIGDNDVGNIGKFVDKHGKVFFEDDATLESDYNDSNSEIIDYYPIVSPHGYIAPPLELQDNNNYKSMDKRGV